MNRCHDRVEGIDPIHRRAFLFHAFDAKSIGPAQGQFAGADQLGDQAVAAPPGQILTALSCFM